MCNMRHNLKKNGHRKAFQVLLTAYKTAAAAPQNSQQQPDSASSTTCSAPLQAVASQHAGLVGGLHKDPLSLPMHEVLVDLLLTSMMRRQDEYAEVLLDALLGLDADMQPGARLFVSLL
jgi:hypothetical protein